jgi:hypothetical protein
MTSPATSKVDASHNNSLAAVRMLVAEHMWSSRTSTAPAVSVDLDTVITLGLRRHYSAALSAARWADLCEDRTYGHHELIAAIIAALPSIGEQVFANGAPGAGFHVVSLGPGDGSVDCEVVRFLDNANRLNSFTGIDLSFELLRRSIRRIAKARAARDLPVTALWGDFTDPAAAQLVESISGSRVFLLTGFTLGNYEESTLLRSIRAQMRTGDYLVLDARVRDESSADPAALVRHYDADAVNRFVFSPVELATVATTRDVTFGHDLLRRFTVVPNSLNVILYCVGLNTVLRSSGALVQRERVDLAMTTIYVFDDLTAWLATNGFDVTWKENRGGIGLFLMRPSGTYV